MFVLIIRHKENGLTLGVIEKPDDVSEQEVVRHWVASQGMTEDAVETVESCGAPVVEWDRIKNVFTPCSELES